jgi:hypothetical protein
MIQQISDWLKKYGIYILLFIGLMLIAFLFGKCSAKQERSQQIANLAAARDSINESYVVIGGLKYQVSTRDAIIITKDESIQVGLLEQERLKKLNIKYVVTNAELQGVIKIQRDSLKLVPGTEIISVKDTVGIFHDYTKIPFILIDFSNEWLTLSAGMNKDRTAWYKSLTPLKGIMTIGYQKSGFLKTKPIGIFTSKNPYLTINQMDILIVQEKPKWYSKWWVPVLGGAVGIEVVRIFLIK